ncbi:MAG: 2-hydroxyacyl-CoA dehydratase family protein, partial [Phycisphaerae bacterium]|nr:2-hydroxyacyl-CoA dehydratase family protein [Phycisphaerae bacterium]
RALMTEVYDLASKVPTPARRNDMQNFAFIMSLLFGTENAIELASLYRDEFKRKVETGVSGVKNEKIRLLWFQNRIQFKNSLDKMLEEEFNAAIVVDELNNVHWDPVDPDNPWEGIAERMLKNPLAGEVDRRIKNLVKLVRKNKVDGVICPCHWGCRQGTGARGMIVEGLKKEGIPVLNLETDCIDPRNFSEGQLVTRLQAFAEMILNRKAKSG